MRLNCLVGRAVVVESILRTIAQNGKDMSSRFPFGSVGTARLRGTNRSARQYTKRRERDNPGVERGRVAVVRRRDHFDARRGNGRKRKGMSTRRLGERL